MVNVNYYNPSSTLLEGLDLGAGKGNADAESLFSGGFFKTGLGLLGWSNSSGTHLMV